MHTDVIPPDAGGSHRMRGSLRPQGDGRKPLPHLVTGLLTLLATLAIGHFSGIAQGPQGAPGTNMVISKAATDYGVCAYFGPDASGHTRFQLSAPTLDASGSYCKKGTLVSVVPGR